MTVTITPPPVLGHQLHHRIHDIGGAKEFSVHRRAPGSGDEFVGRHVFGRAGAVHQHVDGADLLFDVLHPTGRCGPIRQIAGERDRPGQRDKRLLGVVVEAGRSFVKGAFIYFAWSKLTQVHHACVAG
nr:hypothetical protein [Mycoplana dimorpha]